MKQNIIALIATIIAWVVIAMVQLSKETVSLGSIIISFVGAFAVVLITLLVIRKYQERKADKKRELEHQQYLAAQKQKEEAEKEEGRQMLAELLKKSEILWQDLLVVLKKGVYPPEEIILSANFLSLLRVSEIKKQIAFNSEQIYTVADRINGAIGSCYDDASLQKAIDQFKKLENLRAYKGFDRLLQIFRSRTHIEEFCV